MFLNAGIMMILTLQSLFHTILRFPYIFNDIDPRILHTFWTVIFGDVMNTTVLEKVIFNEKEVEFSKLNEYYNILLTIDTLP